LRACSDGSPTYGGYSTQVLVHERFVLSVPGALPLEHTAPLLCAGITMYSPIRKFELDKPGMRVGVVGLGGLGHMAVKFLAAMGVSAVVISTSPAKREEALRELGAKEFLCSKDEAAMKVGLGIWDALCGSGARLGGERMNSL
jgi:8-hydroxygeraniol dehydrogenase